MGRYQQAFRVRFFPDIVQFSPVRSGSTLVWNALKVLFPDAVIPKRHDLNPLIRSRFHPCRIVTTIRDPRDSIVSMLRISGQSVQPSSVESKLRELVRHGLDDVMRIRDRPRVLIFRYEEIHADPSMIFAGLGPFFKLSVDPSAVRDFLKRFEVGNVRAKSERLGVFENFDKMDHVHGGHVSPDLGRPGGFRNVLDDESRAMIERRCAAFMRAFGYDRG